MPEKRLHFPATLNCSAGFPAPQPPSWVKPQNFRARAYETAQRSLRSDSIARISRMEMADSLLIFTRGVGLNAWP